MVEDAPKKNKARTLSVYTYIKQGWGVEEM